MAEIIKNLTPISVEEFIEKINNKNYKIKGYYSLYITPKGEVFDCRFPIDLGHNNFSESVYTQLEQLPENLFNSYLRGLNVPFKEVTYYLMEYFNLHDVMYIDPNLHTTIEKILLGSEDIICQDLGFIKLAINAKYKSFEIVVPNSIFGHKITGAQKDCIDSLSTHFNLSIDERLKFEQKDNMETTIKIKEALKELKKATV